MIFLWLACSAPMPTQKATILPSEQIYESVGENLIEGYVFYNDLRQYGHFAWRQDVAGAQGVRCSFHLDDCTRNYLGAWGVWVEAYADGKVLQTDRVKSNGHFQLFLDPNISYSIRFLLRYCPGDICFSFQDDSVVYQLWHPQASLDEPLFLADGAGIVLEAALFQPEGVDDAQADDHVHSANHFASLMELFYIWHGSTNIPFRSEAFGELIITLPTTLDTSGRTRGPSDIQIPHSNGWIKGNKIMHEYGHVINLRAWDGSYWFDGDPSPQWSATAPQDSHIAFKEGFANFIARSSGSKIRCSGSFDSNTDGHFELVGTMEDGLFYPRNVTKFLCDWYDLTDDDDPNISGYGDIVSQAKPSEIFEILENTLVYARTLNDRELSYKCSFVQAAIDLNKARSSESEHNLYRENIEAMAQNNHISCPL